jgi:hypothetical protein
MKKIEKIVENTKILEILFAIAMLLIMVLIGLITIDQKKLERRIQELNKHRISLTNRVNLLEIQNKIYEYDLEQINEYHNSETD